MEKPIIPVKDYGERERPGEPDSVAQMVEHHRAHSVQLQYNLDVALSRLQRLQDVVAWEIEFWEHGLIHGQWTEGPTALKRRLSMLRGALEFQGVAAWVDKKRR